MIICASAECEEEEEEAMRAAAVVAALCWWQACCRGEWLEARATAAVEECRSVVVVAEAQLQAVQMTDDDDYELIWPISMN